MTHIEDLHVGDWIAITRMREPQCDHHARPSMFEPPQPREVVYDGEPLLLVAVSLPFVCVEWRAQRRSIDIRRFAVQRLEPDYVGAMMSRPEVRQAYGLMKSPTDYPAELTCDSCGGHNVLRLRSGETEWRRTCRECGRQA